MSLSGGAFPPSIVPSQQRMALSTNYLSFNDAAGGGTLKLKLRDMETEPLVVS
jgi:hypothetical protein